MEKPHRTLMSDVSYIRVRKMFESEAGGGAMGGQAEDVKNNLLHADKENNIQKQV